VIGERFWGFAFLSPVRRLDQAQGGVGLDRVGRNNQRALRRMYFIWCNALAYCTLQNLLKVLNFSFSFPLCAASISRKEAEG